MARRQKELTRKSIAPSVNTNKKMCIQVEIKGFRRLISQLKDILFASVIFVYLGINFRRESCQLGIDLHIMLSTNWFQ